MPLFKSKSPDKKELESVPTESSQGSGDKMKDSLPAPRLLLPTEGFTGFPSDFDQRSLTSASAMFDRDGKGYLDPTERALRSLDTDNQGRLDMDKICYIMESLQQEQSKSSSLIGMIRKEQQKTMNLKKVIIALAVFSVLLALSNVGTSFAAAKLAQDTSIQSQTNDLLAQDSGLRVGTTSKYVSVSMEPVDADTRRKLSAIDDTSSSHRRTLEERMLQDICTTATSDGSTTTTCEVVGTISYADAIQIYWSFCPNWPQQPVCRGGGVDKLQLVCKGAVTTLFGGNYLPNTPPTDWDDMMAFTIFPTQYQGYYGEKVFATHSGLGAPRCTQPLDIAMYCPKTGEACFVFGSWPEDKCNQPIQFCG
jgi:hypothetical protein